MSPFVRHVRPVGGSTLEIEFETGERRIFDMTPYLWRGVFTRLRDRSIFMSARVVAGSVEWAGGIDLSYDTLYVESLNSGDTGPQGRRIGAHLRRSTKAGV